ncbi:MAG: nucleoside triphosphate pyrophosphohydrolase [Gammaproteobacteria bacterium]
MKEMEKLLWIMKSLRDPETGCPWDREQSMDSIRGYTLEEAYEVVDAIERGSMEDIRDELGDLLFHIIFYAEMANEQGAFDFPELVEKAAAKLERRHPHVFADMEVENSEQVKKIWEQNKQKERQQQERASLLLDDISAHQPAMLRALKLQKRAAGVGFDWNNSSDIIAKIEEELHELKESIQENDNPEHIAEELGDLMFCCVNLARHFHIDPELALRQTNNKFVERFNYIESTLKRENKSLDETGLEEMDRLWNEAKTNTNT